MNIVEYIYKNIQEREGYNIIVSPENSELELIELGILYFPKAGMVMTKDTGEKELGINILGGRCSIKIYSEDFGNTDFNDVGQRLNPFDGLPYMVYIPTKTKFIITSISKNFEAAMYYVSTVYHGKPKMVSPNEIKCDKPGCLNWTREVRLGFGQNIEAGSLILGETLSYSGNWSSYPPHKHDEFKLPKEAPYEEVYYFRFKPQQGFCFIRLYTSKEDKQPFDKAYAVEDRDAIAIPRGYHPISTAPGYQMVYLFALAAKRGRVYGAWSDDPTHAWVKDCESIIKTAK